jgi:hypothetical protein
MRGEMGSTGRLQYAHLRRGVPFALAGLSECAIKKPCRSQEDARDASSINRKLHVVQEA